jgi:hypothetical protein
MMLDYSSTTTICFFFLFEETHLLESVFYEPRWASKTPVVPAQQQQ